MQRPPWLGKLIGGAIGWLVLGPVGLMIGLLLGHVADKTHIVRQLIGPALEGTRGTFFQTTFMLMGHVAKCDGR